MSELNTSYKNPFIETMKDIIASFAGSAACVYTGQPLDTIKVRMQVNAGKFGSPISSLLVSIKEEGVFSLWKGSTPALIGALAENTVAFAVNGMLKRLIDNNNSFSDSNSNSFKLNSWYTQFLTGGMIFIII